VHRLVRVIARTRSRADGTAQDAIGRVKARLASIYSSDPHGSSILSRTDAQLLPHMLAHSRLLWPRAAEPLVTHALSPSWIQMALSKASRLAIWRRSTTASERQLTVMFCDLTGTTAASERLTPAEIVDSISSFQATCVETITEFGGSVARVIADSVLAYFGYPNAHEDDAARSIHAGLALIKRLKERQLSAVVRLPVRIFGQGTMFTGSSARTGRKSRVAILPLSAACRPCTTARPDRSESGFPRLAGGESLTH
jgi:adenylate/guanylate cyclase family protein